MVDPPPWPDDDRTGQLPDPTTELPGPPPGVLDVTEADPSRWPPVADQVVRYAPVGTGASWARLARFVTVHPAAWRLDHLEAVGDLDGYDELDAFVAWRLRFRWALVAAGAGGIGVAVWRLAGDHGMWPLFGGSIGLSAWYTAKGWVLVRRSARRPMVAEAGPPAGSPAPGPMFTAGPAWSDPLVRHPAGPDHPAGPGPDPTVELPDQPTGPVGLLRGVRRRHPGPVRPAPATRPEPGPCPLTQERVERALKAAEAKLRRLKTEDGEPVIQVVGSKHMGNGWAVSVYMPEEVSAADMTGARSGIANAFSTLERGVPESCVVLLPDPANPRLLTLWICDTPPLEGPPVRTSLWDVEQVDVHEGIPFGRTIEGERVLVSPVGTHWLIAGGTGSGKSESGGLLPLGCALDPHVRLILMDPEGLGAWAAYRGVAEVIHGTSAQKLAEMADKLAWVVEEEFPRRERAIAEYLERGSLVMAKPKVTPRMAQDPTAGLEWLVICVEEAQALYRAADSEVKKRAVEASVQIITRGRKYGISLHEFTQKPTDDNIPTAITAIANTRLLFSVEFPTMADAAMPGWRKLGMDPLSLQPDDGRGGGNPGAGYLKGIGLVEPHRKWVLMRAECADLGEAREILRRARAMRLQVRPELLPDHGQVRPAAPGGARMAVTDRPVLDLEPLQRIVAVLEEHGTMLATDLIAELSDRHPVEHGDVVTIGELNELLAPYSLRTRQPRRPDRSRPHQLAYSTCSKRLQALRARSERP